MSMGERGEAPDGMAGIIRYELACSAHYGTAPAQKKRRMRRFRGAARNPMLKPGFDTCVSSKTSAFRRLRSESLHGDPRFDQGGHMSVVSAIIGTAERVPLPDVVIRAAIQRLCSRSATRLSALSAADDAAFAGRMMLRPIAGEADAGHHDAPASFFAQVLGPNLKYSSCFYKTPATTLREAEEEALRQSVEHAGLADGQTILELGCGWGSLSLWMARQFPHAKITAVSNSQDRRAYVEDMAQQRGLLNLRVVTA